MDRHNKHDLVHVCRDSVQFDFQGFIITIAFTGTVITGMGNGTVS
jgi:hypothetical protein